jgi:hypothetical protein
VTKTTFALVFSLVGAALLASGCGSEHPAARVAGTPIAKERVEAVLEHAEEEARHEGRVFPDRGTQAYEQAEHEALDLVIYHEELAKKAAQLGITVSDEEVEGLIGGKADEEPGEGEAASKEEEEEGGAFAEESLRAALLYTRIYERVTAGVRVSPAEVSAYYGPRARTYRARGLSPEAARKEIARDLLTSKRTAAMAKWVARMRRDFAPQVSYGKESRS